MTAAINPEMPKHFHFTLQEYKSEFHGVGAEGKRVGIGHPAKRVLYILYILEFI